MKPNSPRVLRGIVLVAALSLLTSPIWAHGDEDHSHDPKPPVVTAASPVQTTAARRLPDASLFVPKAVQRQLGIRTVLAATQTLARAVELNGRVMADPQAGGRVQASQAGRIEAVPQGWPVLGQKVVKGQVLLRLRPTLGSIERGNQRAALAEVEAQWALAQRKVVRYSQLEGVVPKKDMEAARDELIALQQRKAALSASLGEVEALVAPASGVISASHVVNGQVVEAREVLLEVVDPTRLGVEALAYDVALVQGITHASAVLPGGAPLALQFVGGGRQLREQALPLLFRIQDASAAVAVGQNLKVIAKTTRTIQGVAVPQAALARSGAGDAVVWVHAAAERFVQRRVSAQALDAQTAVVTKGLANGERVVSMGANLLDQVR